MLHQQRLEIGVSARPAAEYVQAQRTVFGKRVAGNVRFRKQAHSGDPAGMRKLMPLRFAERMQVQFADERSEKFLERALIGQRGRIAAVCFHDPFKTAHVVER